MHACGLLYGESKSDKNLGSECSFGGPLLATEQYEILEDSSFM
jgi:hypothetical protein